jgi:hypothetical protein
MDLSNLGFPPELLAKLREEAGGDRARLFELLRAHEPVELLDVEVRDGDGRLQQTETNRLTKRGRVTSLSQRRGTDVEYEVRGSPPQTEEGADEVIARLSQFIAAGRPGWGWTVPSEVRREDGADGAVLTPDGVSIGVQVTRPVPSADFYGQVARGEESLERKSDQDLVDDLLRAGASKSLLAGRDALILGFDAVSLTHLGQTSVLEAARQRESEFLALGFRAVYLVGPSEKTVVRLDPGPVRGAF